VRHDPSEFWEWLWPKAVAVVVLLVLMALAQHTERWAFDECRKTNTAAYCTFTHWGGAHP
jgi:hypothetical protein